MLCLHGKEAIKSTTENGTFWFCNQTKKCHFICSEEQGPLYQKGVKAFLDTHQGQPRCCDNKIPCVKVLTDDDKYIELPAGYCTSGRSTRRYAKMKVVTDMKNTDFGRPFFVCSKKYNRCNYFEWGDQKILEKPL